MLFYFDKLKIKARDNAHIAYCISHGYEDGYLYYGKRKLLLRKNIRQAFFWVLHAARLGNTDAMIYLAHFYSKGSGCKKNLIEALKWEKKAYRCGNDCAALNLGCSYNLLHKYRLAYQWFQKAYIHDIDASYQIGKCYLFGKGVKKNLNVALHYFYEVIRNNTFPIDKIHAMKLIVDIRCNFSPTTDPVRIRLMPISIIKKRVEIYLDELKRNPNNEAVYYCLGQLYYYHHLYNEALPFLRKCKQLSFCLEDVVQWIKNCEGASGDGEGRGVGF